MILTWLGRCFTSPNGFGAGGMGGARLSQKASRRQYLRPYHRRQHRETDQRHLAGQTEKSSPNPFAGRTICKYYLLEHGVASSSYSYLHTYPHGARRRVTACYFRESVELASGS